MQGFLQSVAVACVCALVACSGEPESPEERIRATIATMAEAVEAKDAALLKHHVADDYRDAASRDRRELGQLLTFYAMRHQSFHVMARVKEIVFRDPGHAEVVAVVATAGRPIETGVDLATLRADVYHLDLDMVEQGGEWLVAWAQWRPTPAADLF